MAKFPPSEPKISDQEETLKTADVFLEESLRGVPEEEAESVVLLKLAEQGINVIIDQNGEWRTIEEIADNILNEIKDIPEEKQEEELFKKLKEEYGLEIGILSNGEWFINEEFDKTPPEEKVKRLEGSGKWKIYARRVGLVSAAAAIAFASIIKSKDTFKYEKESTKNKLENEREVLEEKENEKKLVIKNILKRMERFDQSSYESLSGNGKIVYELMQKNNLTPDKNYAIADKATGELYIIDKNNRLIHHSSVITGAGRGDVRDPAKRNEDITVTGIGSISKNFVHPDDRTEYGEYQFSIFEIGENGEKISDIGWHQTYDSLHRDQAYSNPDPEARMMSHACLNQPKSEMEKWVLPNFEGDGSELIFILPGTDLSGKVRVFNPEPILPAAMEARTQWMEAERKLREDLKTGKAKLSS